MTLLEFRFAGAFAAPIACALFVMQTDEVSARSTLGSASGVNHASAIVVDNGYRDGEPTRVSAAPTIGSANAVSGYSATIGSEPGDSENLRTAQSTMSNSGRITIAVAPEYGNVSTSRGTISGPFFNFIAITQGGLHGGMPLAFTRMSSKFGMRRNPVTGGLSAHKGVDLAAPAGTPVAVAGDGVVSKATYFGSYGLYVAVEHGNGTQSRYAHLSRLNVSPGQKVRAGEIIGFVGSTGRSTGPHLHFEVRKNGLAVDPLNSLQR